MAAREKIHSFVKDKLLHGQALDDKESLWDSGAIDSLGILALTRFLESELGVKVPDKDINLTNFHSVESLARYVERRK